LAGIFQYKDISQNSLTIMKKTNAARILEQNKIKFDLIEYDVDESDLTAETVAKKVDKPIEIVFKTLVLQGDKSGNIVAVIPGNMEVNLKALSKISGNKKVMMLPMKEILPLTGYIRGGVSPVGMKKSFPTFVDESALNHNQICISAGIRGLQMLLSPTDLIKVTKSKTGTISE
jgi:Cys-tRNA(Pro)/Cys-tRNA(Cys) deacylase